MIGTIDATYMQWYRAAHDRNCQQSGNAFEEYATSALALFHPGFINPEPMGSLGDGGCDGITGDGSIMYACYGSDVFSALSTPEKQKSRALTNKLRKDFVRGCEKWSTFVNWRFVTNAKIDMNATKELINLRSSHGPGSARPIQIDFWSAPKDFWFEVVSKLSKDALDQLFPGAPHARNTDLAELVRLLNLLEDEFIPPDSTLEEIRPVSAEKLDYNTIHPITRLEFSEGRVVHWRIDRWFGEQGDPDLRDTKAATFRAIFDRAQDVSTDPAEIIESIYVAVGGSDFRSSKSRANAVYAIVSYFFDACDIFHEPPAGWKSGDPVAFAN